MLFTLNEWLHLWMCLFIMHRALKLWGGFFWTICQTLHRDRSYLYTTPLAFSKDLNVSLLSITMGIKRTGYSSAITPIESSLLALIWKGHCLAMLYSLWRFKPGIDIGWGRLGRGEGLAEVLLFWHAVSEISIGWRWMENRTSASNITPCSLYALKTNS